VLADDIFSESVRTNDVTVGVAGSKRRIQERLAGFPDLPADIEDMFSADDKVVTRLVWRETHTVHMRASRPPASGAGPGLCHLAFQGRPSG
jgi:predicted ester cyclase